MLLWLGVVLVGTGIAGLRGRLPGVEPAPYIIRFTEDRPNPLYRRVCYTLAWSEVITFAVLNITGLIVRDRDRASGGCGRSTTSPTSRSRARSGCSARSASCRASSGRPRVKGTSGAIFYGSVWAVCIAQPILWLLWKVLPHTRTADAVKLVVFVGVLAWVGNLARRGLLPRTRPIVPGDVVTRESEPVESRIRTRNTENASADMFSTSDIR